jgi:hypothetical protein
MRETKILNIFQMNGNYPFSQQYTSKQNISIFERFLKK